MAKFAFRTDHHEEDVLASRSSARGLRDTLRGAGHKAHVERSGPKGDPEHRVYIKHPTDKQSVAYVNREEAPRLAEGDWKPYWIQK